MGSDYIVRFATTEAASGVTPNRVWEDSPMGTSEAVEAIVRHVEAFNHGVRSGDFSRTLEGFTNDAEMVFEGVDSGPYRGVEAIAEAYAKSPPGEEIAIVEAVHRQDGTAVASYAWKSQPAVVAGEMRMSMRGSKIAHLVVALGTHSPDVMPS